jgi:hypothetical protein
MTGGGDLKKIAMLFILALLLKPHEARGEELFFTFLGVTLGGGAHQVEYSDWVVDHRETISASGSYYSGGAIMDVFVNRLIGEFTLQAMNTAAGDITVQHLYYTVTGKYAFYMGNLLFAAAGGGLYFESGPASRNYDGGGGVNAVLGMGINAAHDWRIMLDLSGRYGSFGIGDEATRVSYGISVAAVYRIGRL